VLEQDKASLLRSSGKTNGLHHPLAQSVCWPCVDTALVTTSIRTPSAESSAKPTTPQYTENMTAYCRVTPALNPTPAHHLTNDRPVTDCRKGCCSLGNLPDRPFAVPLVTDIIYSVMLKQYFLQKQVCVWGEEQRIFIFPVKMLVKYRFPESISRFQCILPLQTILIETKSHPIQLEK